MIKTLNSLDKGGNIIDLTGAADDYPLQVGETAVITYTSATSVPLHVATVEGVYEVEVFSSHKTPTGTSGASFMPNGTTASNITVMRLTWGLGVGNNTFTGYSSFPCGNGNVLYAKLMCSTSTQSKTATTLFQSDRSDGMAAEMYICKWINTDTVWTSLGIITFGESQSGKIVIRRIA